MVNRDNLLAFLLVVAFAATAAGCAGALTTQTDTTPIDREAAPNPSDTLEAPTTPITPPASSPDTETPGRGKGLGEVPAEILEEILTDLVQRTGAERQDIQVVRAQSVTWSDASLGCPKKGMVYIQVLINGYWVILEVEGVEYDYRVADTGNFTLCEAGDISVDPVPLMPVAPHGKPPRDDRNQEP